MFKSDSPGGGGRVRVGSGRSLKNTKYLYFTIVMCWCFLALDGHRFLDYISQDGKYIDCIYIVKIPHKTRSKLGVYRTSHNYILDEFHVFVKL